MSPPPLEFQNTCCWGSPTVNPLSHKILSFWTREGSFVEGDPIRTRHARFNLIVGVFLSDGVFGKNFFCAWTINWLANTFVFMDLNYPSAFSFVCCGVVGKVREGSSQKHIGVLTTSSIRQKITLKARPSLKQLSIIVDLWLNLKSRKIPGDFGEQHFDIKKIFLLKII